MRPAPLHIAFNLPGAASLEKAICLAGRNDGVICSLDDLALGPINPPELQLRSDWMTKEHRHKGWSELLAREAEFWNGALSQGERRIAWFSRISATEYCGFLEWLSRIGDEPCEIIDLTDMSVGHLSKLTLGLLSAENIAASAVWDRAESLDAATRQRYQTIWRQLCNENAPLRIVDAEGLRSAPITFFDQLLISFAKVDWQTSASIIVRMLELQMAEPQFLQARSTLLTARIISLVDSGLLEGRGNLKKITEGEVRLRHEAP